MPQVEKRALSQYLRVRCDRYLHQSLYRADPDESHLLPLAGRPGVAAFRARGIEFEKRKFEEIEQVFPAGFLNINKLFKRYKGKATPDEYFEKFLVSGVAPFFFAEPTLSSDCFRDLLLAELGLDPKVYPDISQLRPDLVELVEIGSLDRKNCQMLLPDGSISRINPQDNRKILRVIDLKATEHINASYASEVVAYSMVLAAWLAQRKLNDRYVVLANPGIWVSGTYYTHQLPKSSDPNKKKITWAYSQIEWADSHLYAPVVLKFLKEDVPRVMDVDDWRSDLDWGLNQTCSQCDYLGYPAWSKKALKDVVKKAYKLDWKHVPSLDEYCFTEAEDNGLAMQIPGLTIGMRKVLVESNKETLSDVSALQLGEPVFAKHNGLKRDAKIIPNRASAILSQSHSFKSGYQNVQIAQYADLRLTINISFDAASRMLMAIGLGIDYTERVPRGQDAPSDRLQQKNVMAFLVDKQDPVIERENLLDFLRTISYLLEWIGDKASYNSNGDNRAQYARRSTRLQAIFWDENQELVLREAIGRHLHYLVGFDVLKAVFWLFPAEMLVDAEGTAMSPMSGYLKNVISGYAFLPNTISDDLISSAEALISSFDARLSDFQWDYIAGVIPRERGLEIWMDMPPKKPPKSIAQCRSQYEQIMKTLVHAMRRIMFDFLIDHPGVFSASAPTIPKLIPTATQGVAKDSILWLSHYGFEEGVGRMEVQIALSTDPYELEAKYSALRTNGLLDSSAAAKYLSKLNLKVKPNRKVFHTRPESRFVKYRNNESFLTLIPEFPAGSGLMSATQLRDAVGIDIDLSICNGMEYCWSIAQQMSATLVRFDRQNDLAVIDISTWGDTTCRDLLLQHGLLDFNSPMVLVEGSGKSWLEEIRHVAKSIGNPNIAKAAPETAAALLGIARNPGKSRVVPAARILWEPWTESRKSSQLSEKETEKALDDAASGLGFLPNSSQKNAVKDVVGSRFHLVWGGPGTGKTETLALAILTDILVRVRSGSRARILVTGPTYRAVAEIVERIERIWNGLPSSVQAELSGCHSLFASSKGRLQELWPGVSKGVFCDWRTSCLEGGGVAKTDGAKNEKLDLGSARKALLSMDKPILVFATRHQCYKLGTGGDRSGDVEPVAELFDHIWIDESSQISVADALPILALLDDSGGLSLFGDRLQMPPIQRTRAPVGAEWLVGSIHAYLLEKAHLEERTFTGVDPTYRESFLDTNYRSCKPIVEFSYSIGYETSFHAEYPDRTLQHVELSCGGSWNQVKLPYEPSLHEAILDPRRPCVAVTYNDKRNGQANIFEASLVAGTILTHRDSLLEQAQNRGEIFDEEKFWVTSIGVVTPHRAQRATVIMLLQEALGSVVPFDYYDAAVDTVERFQGGERDLILVSFGIGDPDLIQHEEEFLFQKERINVAITRARAKVVLFVTRDLSFHLPEEQRVIEDSKAIKDFVFQHADKELTAIPVQLADQTAEVRIRYREY